MSEILTVTLGLLAQSQVHGAQFKALNLPPINLVATASDSSNNVYVLGTFTNVLNFAGKSFVSRGGLDYVLAQYRADGAIGWAISFGTTQDEGTYSTRLIVGSNALFINGTTPASIHIVDSASNVVDTAYGGGDDGFLFKFSLSGVAQWQASMTGTSAGDHGRGVASDAAGNVYWCGGFNGCCPAQGGGTLTGGDGTVLALSTPSFATAFLTKLSPTGHPLWVVRAYNRDVGFYYGVTVDSLGSVIVAGGSRSSSSGGATTLIDGRTNTFFIPNPGYQSAFVAKFGSDGAYQWSAYSSGSPDSVDYITWFSMATATNGDVLFGGSYNTLGVSITGANAVSQALPTPTGQDGFVAALSAAGSVKWLRQIGGSGAEIVNEISVGANSGLTAAGSMTAGLSVGSTNVGSLGGGDGFIVKLDQNGGVLNAFALGGTGSDEVRSVVAGATGYDVVGGNQGGNFSGLGVQISNAGPFVLTISSASPCIAHRAIATAQLVNGFVVGATITDGGCGYTNTPLVIILGGGGTGATATAVVSNGVVVGITITDAGTGYTSAPTIYIYAPLGPQIALLKAVKPSFSDLFPGTNYQLQLSADLNTWTNQGSPFTATNPTMVYPQYWDVDNWGQLFFRLRVAP